MVKSSTYYFMEGELCPPFFLPRLLSLPSQVINSILSGVWKPCLLATEGFPGHSSLNMRKTCLIRLPSSPGCSPSAFLVSTYTLCLEALQASEGGDMNPGPGWLAVRGRILERCARRPLLEKKRGTCLPPGVLTI